MPHPRRGFPIENPAALGYNQEERPANGKNLDYGGMIMQIPIEYVRTQEFTMRFFRFGHGSRALIILPGLSVQSVMGSADQVAAAYAQMTDDFTVYVFDRREDLPPSYSVREMARDTAAAIRALGLRGADLFGASQGGMIALQIAADEPDLVRRMVLGSTTARVQDAQFAILQHWIDLAQRRDAEGLYLALGEKIYPPEVFRQYRPALLEAAKTVTQEDLDRFVILARGTRGFDVTDRLDRIRCGVLIIGVYEDAILDSDATMEIAERLDDRPDFRLYMYVGYGHAAYDTAPDYRDRIRRYLLQG